MIDGPPWEAWLVAALLVQRERQRWHHEVMRAIPDEADEGDVAPGWRFWRHGMGALLTGPEGEALDVDFHDETGEAIDVWFFAYRVESLANAPSWLAERRLWRWRPKPALIVDGIDELVDRGLLVRNSGNTIVLSAVFDGRSSTVAAELASRDHWERWLAALEPGGESPHLAPHRAWLRARMQTSERPGDLLELAAANASDAEAIELATPLLSRNDWNAAKAIELLRARRSAPPVAEVAALLRRLSLADDHPYPAFQACAYLLERGIEPAFARERFDAWSTLEQAHGYGGNPYGAEFACYALEHVPDRAMPLVRQVLRSTTPLCVATLTALLEAIDQPWCHRELAAALDESEETAWCKVTATAEVQALAKVLRDRFPADWGG